MKQNYYKKFYSTVSLTFLVLFLFAQDYPNNSNISLPINEESIYFAGINTSLRPFNESESIIDSILYYSNNSNDKSFFIRKLLYENTIVFKDAKHALIINPIIDFRYNSDNGRPGYLNTRGINIFGKLSNKIWFSTSFYENQGVFPEHIKRYYSKYGVLPGYNRVKSFKTNAYDFAKAHGKFTYQPIKNLSFTLGTDNNFIGDGYRSLLLSDYSTPYFFIKSSYKYKKLSFNHIISQVLNPNYNNIMGVEQNWRLNTYYPSKYISYNYLTWHPTKDIQIGFFEAIIFDAQNPDKTWNYNALNPLIFANTIQFGYNDSNNALTGINFSYQNSKYGVLYSQFLIDNISYNNSDYENRLAYQLGYKTFNFGNVKNLYLQIEFNHVDILTYSHENPTQHYGHFNQSLAHPAGSGFNEYLAIISYQIHRIEFLSKLNYLEYKYSGSFDNKNIFNQSEFLEPNLIIYHPNKILYFDSQIIIHINPLINLQAFGGIVIRKEFYENTNNTFIQFGVRTSLRTNYYDF
jgi:hypothetical protein